MKIDKKLILIITVLLIGFCFRLFLTRDGNFLFNMDNARDFVDVREMVELKKMRLIGPTSAIDGLFNGPIWYYLLAVPYIISNGDPYAAVLMMNILWFVGGLFLLRFISKLNALSIILVGLIWATSDYIVLASLYSFNPSPVLFLTPVFVYLILKYLETKKLLFSFLSFFTGGVFFNFEMNFGVFVPAIIFFTVLFYKRELLKTVNFWLGSIGFIICLIPQIFFDLRHQFIMSNAVLGFLQTEGEKGSSFNITTRFNILFNTFKEVYSSIFMNKPWLVNLSILLIVIGITQFIKEKKQNAIVTIGLLLVFVPFITFLFIPVQVNTWHLGAEIVGGLILLGYFSTYLYKYNLWGKLLVVVLTFITIFYSFNSILKSIQEKDKPNTDPSLYKNEVAAIDYVYQRANGKNFKVYIYLPSVIDYPYQYLIWWKGLNQYGYLPEDYAYHPGKPQYISNKESFSATPENLAKRENSNLLFLIKEPDRIQMRKAWVDDFDPLKIIENDKLGSIEIEVREVPQQ